MRRFDIADSSMVEELIEMTKTNFGETDSSVRFFFDKKVDLNNCLVCLEDGKPVSQLHMLPIGLRNKGTVIPAHYIYAASTLPGYRGRGCMTQLIKMSHKVAQSRGQKFSVLSPATEGLFGFYGKIGYYKFHKYREVILTAEEMRKFRSGNKMSPDIDYSRVMDIRSEFFSADGEVIWDRDSVKYAFDMNEDIGGRNIFNENGYVISSCFTGNRVDTYELAYLGDNIETLLAELYNTYRDRDGYIIRLPVRNKFFGDRGRIVDKCMICPVYDKEREELIDFVINTAKINPCMGFVLE